MATLDTNGRKEVTYFIGTEVEHTCMYGEKTLFVVGIHELYEIIKHAEDNDITHIYLGTSQSFNPSNTVEWIMWSDIIEDLLHQSFTVTLDFDVSYAAQVSKQTSWLNNTRFIPMISVKIPNIENFNLNTTLKVDDITWGHSNSGVWTHKLKSLLSAKKFTAWDQYVGDINIR